MKSSCKIAFYIVKRRAYQEHKLKNKIIVYYILLAKGFINERRMGDDLTMLGLIGWKFKKIYKRHSKPIKIYG